MSGTRSSRRAAIACLLVAAGGVLAVDVTLVEPFRLEVTHYRIPAPVAAPLRIAHVTDLHTHGLGRRELAVLDALERERPDVILMSGDSISTSPEPEIVAAFLDRLHAPLGIYLVLGNWEHWHAVEAPATFYPAHGVHLLLNENARIRDDVWIAGFDDLMLGTPDLDAGLDGIPPGGFVVGLFHSPAFFDRMQERVPISFAGHTHGGQVRVPFLRPFWLPRGAGRFLEGWYENGAAKMYVGRGLGTSVLPIRFNCRPELAIVTLVPMTTSSAAAPSR